MMDYYEMKDNACDDLPHGVIIGTVESYDCDEGTDGCRWHVRNPERAEKLLKPTKHPQQL